MYLLYYRLMDGTTFHVASFAYFHMLLEYADMFIPTDLYTRYSVSTPSGSDYSLDYFVEKHKEF